MSRVFAAIPDPTTTPESLREAILALKSAVEAITRQTKSSDEDFLAALGLSVVAASGSFFDLLGVGAWTAYTPTATPASGTFTTHNTTGSEYLTIGKLTFVYIHHVITTVGTAGGPVGYSIPIAAAGPWAASGAETQSVGFGLACHGGLTNVLCGKASDFTTPLASGNTLRVSGFYRNA